MATGFEACPHCGRKIMKGAMKCMGCGKILKTPEEQQRDIDRYKESQGSSFFGKVFKLAFFLLVAGAALIVYKLYGDQIMRLLAPILKKF